MIVIGKRSPLGTSVVNYGPFITDEPHPFCGDSLVRMAQRWLFSILGRPLPQTLIYKAQLMEHLISKTAE